MIFIFSSDWNVSRDAGGAQQQLTLPGGWVTTAFRYESAVQGSVSHTGTSKPRLHHSTAKN